MLTTCTSNVSTACARRWPTRASTSLLLSVGHDLPYLTGYEAMPLERLTMLVVPREGDATLVVPRLEAPRVVAQPDVFGLRPWEETEDPIGDRRRARRRRVDCCCRRPDVGPLRRRPVAAPSRHTVPPCRRRGGTAADGEGHRRGRRAASRRRRRRPGGPAAAGRRDPARRADRSAGVGRHLGADCWQKVTTRSTSPSSPPARTPPVRTTKQATG